MHFGVAFIMLQYAYSVYFFIEQIITNLEK